MAELPTADWQRSELAQDPRFATTSARVKPEHEQLLREEIERWSVHLTSDEILEKVMADPGPGMVVFGRMESPLEVLSRENWWERGCFEKFSDPIYDELTLQMPVWRMTETPPRVRWACRPAGYHNGYVYQKYLGWGPTRLAALRARAASCNPPFPQNSQDRVQIEISAEPLNTLSFLLSRDSVSRVRDEGPRRSERSDASKRSARSQG